VSVLIAEPDVDLADLMALAAGGPECPARTTGSGWAALRLLHEDPPRVLVAELDLPDLSGEELAVRARLLQPPPMVILVGSDHERLARARGQADRLLRKPFDMACLEAAVAEGCGEMTVAT
jgi:DNA-binding response OmpR family regulator